MPGTCVMPLAAGCGAWPFAVIVVAATIARNAAVLIDDLIMVERKSRCR
jgi:hypothetical protein